ncbi:hypothetical protein RhiXN_07279 [Rhizoctonia solani]|uniref:Uncharacterized protein n=1 Tax=Rhizoctonia solani TaxID=456999 RepID=A0A8H8P4Y4_9AGAM|nr:uncharacterized protein RhiXN_07279 [Rhizoctonia solani]QRW25330.1 hypothetical protein RhiXN_07279 [Rhizoctonia solani]
MIPLHPPTSCGDSDKPEMWKCTSALFYGAAITPGTKPPALNTWTMRIVQVHTQIKWRRFLVLKLTSDEVGRPTGICLEEVPYCIPEKTVAIWEVDDLGCQRTSPPEVDPGHIITRNYWSISADNSGTSMDLLQHSSSGILPPVNEDIKGIDMDTAFKVLYSTHRL